MALYLLFSAFLLHTIQIHTTWISLNKLLIKNKINFLVCWQKLPLQILHDGEGEQLMTLNISCIAQNQQPNIFYSAAAFINYVCLMSPGLQFGDLSENNNFCTNSDTALCGHRWLSSSMLFKSVRFFLGDLLVVVSCLANGLMYFKICPCSQVDRFGGQKSRFL